MTRVASRKVHIHNDGTFSIPGESFVTTSSVLAHAVARELDMIDPIQRKREPGTPTEFALSDLRIGNSTWTVPWAMWQDTRLRWWLHPDYPAKLQPGGTVEMLVLRKPNGYHIFHYPKEMTSWAPTSFPGYESDYWIPVKRRHWLSGGMIDRYATFGSRRGW